MLVFTGFVGIAEQLFTIRKINVLRIVENVTAETPAGTP